jgi:putative ABC transport system ATP-binding protein
VVSGKLRPEAGTVRIDERDVTRLADFQRARYIGRVFQDPMAGTAPHMTIEENLAIAFERGRRRGLRRGVTGAKRERFREDLASLELGLENRLRAKVGLLSGGQRQALSLLMATFSEPRILLLDEHTAALDPQRAALISRLTSELVERHRLTTLMVTHNMEQALRVGNRLIMMHEGQIILDLTEEEKRVRTVKDLLGEFEKIKGATIDDKTLLQ